MAAPQQPSKPKTIERRAVDQIVQPPMPPIKDPQTLPLRADPIGGIIAPEPLADGTPFVVVDPRVQAELTPPYVGRLLTLPSESALEVSAETFMDDDEAPDLYVQLVDDVWEEVFPPGSKTPTHILKFRRGERVLKSQVAHIRARYQETPRDPRATETK